VLSFLSLSCIVIQLCSCPNNSTGRVYLFSLCFLFSDLAFKGCSLIFLFYHINEADCLVMCACSGSRQIVRRSDGS
jgi:hypothetical protein